MMEYAVAFLAAEDNEHQPLVIKDIDSYEEACLIKKSLSFHGHANVTVFWYEEVLPELITWPFVKKHVLTN